MRIAICDDEARDLEQIAGLVRQYGDGMLDISCFDSARALYASHGKEPYDIALLDIEMPEPNGFEIAKKLREHDKCPRIVFTTHSIEYAPKGYGIAFDYLEKPITAKILYPVLDALVSDIQANRIVIVMGDNLEILRLGEICYIESYNHRITVYTTSRKLEFRSTLEELYRQLPQGHFCRPNRSDIVHLKYVREIRPKDLLMVGGTRIPISRGQLRKVQDAFYRYMEGGGKA